MQAWFRAGTPWIWLSAGAIAFCLVMVLGVLGMITANGARHFWPSDLYQVDLRAEDGQTQPLIFELVRTEEVPVQVLIDAGVSLPYPAESYPRHLLKVANRDVYGRDFLWQFDFAITNWRQPKDVIVLERREWGPFFGRVQSLSYQGEVVTTAEQWLPLLQQGLKRAQAILQQIAVIEQDEVGAIHHRLEALRLEQRRMELAGASAAELQLFRELAQAEQTALDADYELLQQQRDKLYEELQRDVLHLMTAEGATVSLHLSDIMHFHHPNQMSVAQKIAHYFQAIWRFLTDEPREANTEGGIFPAIFGTVTMVLLMSILVTPFGVLAAIYLREYAKEGPLLKVIRISVYNLAGVPSIVYGVFGLGFFVYILGGNIDALFYPESLPSPTFGTPGLFWASLTLALLTLPVVIVATEEGLARIPLSIRMGSMALGATKAETLWQVVVPLATPAMMTGLILAIARAAGEVAPLMLVGVVKLAPSLPIDGNFPYIHLEQKIMHLGFHIYDVGFQSPNVEASRPLLYATACVLVALIMLLNLAAINLRNSLREKYQSESE